MVQCTLVQVAVRNMSICGASKLTSVRVHTGHIAGGLAGIYLGWGMGPKLKARAEVSADSEPSQKSALMSLDNPATGEANDAKDLKVVDVISGVQRVSASVALLTALTGFTASVVIQRAGHLSLPRGLGVHL